MTALSVEVTYVVSENVANIVGVNITNAGTGGIPDDCETSVTGNGDISFGAGDSATITYTVINSGNWKISGVQLRDSGDDNWGQQSGRSRLTSNEASDFPDVPADSGSLMADSPATSISMTDNNLSTDTVDYRVIFTDGTDTIYSDPRIKDHGN